MPEAEMGDLPWSANLTAILIVGAGGPALGLAGLLGRRAGAGLAGRLEPTGLSAVTDRGRAIPLYTGTSDHPPEERFRGSLAVHVIRTAPPNTQSNCHGWTFTGGRYCLHPDAVPQILEDNGYEEVS